MSPVPAPTAVVSVRPIVLRAPGRGEDLSVRVSAPVTGRDLPVVLLAHGFGSSLDGYAPLAGYWAARGFVVIQPTHLDSKALGLAADDPRRPRIWRYRVEDMKRVLDRLDVLEAAVPGLAGRLDRGRVAAAGHSFGGQTAGILLGLRVADPQTGRTEDLSDPRVTAGVLLATAGRGGDDLTPFATENFPWLRGPDFSRSATRWASTAPPGWRRARCPPGGPIRWDGWNPSRSGTAPGRPPKPRRPWFPLGGGASLWP